ncbi:MAG: hypothetical protein ACHRHE_15670 [Tepidisphaerales bacterium]
MSTTYTPADLATSLKDQVRFNIGDTDSSDWQLQDEEIQWAITTRGNQWGATSMCANALAGKYARLTAISADGVSQQLGQRITNYRLLADEFERKEVIYCATPSVFGVSVSQMLATLADSDRVPDIFRLAMNDNPPNAGVTPENDPAATGSDAG